MKLFLFKKEDILWWLGLTAFWFMARFILAIPKVVKNFVLPSLLNYCDYLIEGAIVSSLGMITVGFVRKFGEKDKVKEKQVLGIKFIWHKKYVWLWIGTSVFLGGGRILVELYHNISPDILLNFIKGGIFGTVVILVAGLWEGNPGFFEGHYKREKKEEK